MRRRSRAERWWRAFCAPVEFPGWAYWPWISLVVIDVTLRLAGWVA